MIGFPGVFLDSDGPSIVGVVSSVQTTISAEGQAQSSVTIRAARLIFDEELNRTAFSENLKGKDAQTSFIKTNLIQDFMVDSDGLIIDQLYDEPLYSPFKIGLDAYTYMLYGKGHKRKMFKTRAKDISAEDSKSI